MGDIFPVRSNSYCATCLPRRLVFCVFSLHSLRGKFVSLDTPARLCNSAFFLGAMCSGIVRPQDGTPLKDRLFASALCDDGSVVLAGYSEGDWAEANAGGSDLLAVKLNIAVGTETWRWQVRPFFLCKKRCPRMTAFGTSSFKYKSNKVTSFGEIALQQTGDHTAVMPYILER